CQNEPPQPPAPRYPRALQTLLRNTAATVEQVCRTLTAPADCWSPRSPLPLLHHLHEILEQIMRVVWAGAGLRVVLDAEQRQVAVAQAFERLVVQVHVG